jgi:hypothetical protein
MVPRVSLFRMLLLSSFTPSRVPSQQANV